MAGHQAVPPSPLIHRSMGTGGAQMAASFAAAVGPPTGTDHAGSNSTAARALQPQMILQIHLNSG